MSAPQVAAAWRFVRFGLLVTGKGEEIFLPRLFRALMETHQCHFEVIRRIPQLSPITSERRNLTMTGVGKRIASRDEEIGLAARAYLQRHSHSYVALIDDLEGDRVDQCETVFQRYRLLLDTMLGAAKHRAAVHFLTNMLEAYYFADARAVNEVTGAQLTDHEGDVETIPHPKNLLKQQIPGFNVIEHGQMIIDRLNVRHVLSRADACASLRTIFGWCTRALGQPFTEEYRLLGGQFHPVTQPQIDALT
jgi:Domain of unknown function (DUF4276)